MDIDQYVSLVVERKIRKGTLKIEIRNQNVLRDIEKKKNFFCKKKNFNCN